MSGPVRRGGLDVSAQQAAIVDHVRAGRLTVVGAGAGSGKTHTMVATALELLDRRCADLNQFVLITFTRKAAEELRSRLEVRLGQRTALASDEDTRRFWRNQQERLSGAYIGTIHGFCRNILRTFGYQERVARESDVTFASLARAEATAETLEAYLRAGEALLLGPEVVLPSWELTKKIAEILDRIRNQGEQPATILSQTARQPEDPGKPFRHHMARLVAAVDARYQAKKAEAQRLDPHDLLRLTADLLDNPANESVRVRLGGRFRYLFIDEFQDTDRIQLRLAESLLPFLAGVLVVGDPKQSIYGFRAADFLLLSDLAQRQGSPILPLSISRRPTAALLGVQNALFASIGGQSQFRELADPLEPWEGTLPAGGSVPPLVYCSAGAHPTRDESARLLGRVLRTLLNRQITDPTTGAVRPVQPQDIAILCRSNFYVREYERHLRAAGLALRTETGGAYFERPEVVATYYMLRLVLHYPDDTALALALRTEYLRDVNLQETERMVIQYGTRTGSALTDEFRGRYPSHAALLQELREHVRAETVPQILARLFDSFQIQSHYRACGNGQAANNLDHLRELARRLFNNEQALTLWQFTSWLQRAFLTSKEEEEALQEGEETHEVQGVIRLMTIHRAKGLEFPIVVIPEVHAPLNLESRAPSVLVDPDWGLDLQLPLRSGAVTTSERFQAQVAQTRAERLAEEMRIFYVAVTRAQNAVLLVGNEPSRPSPPTSEYYSWRDEVVRAKPRLEALGARFV